MKRLALLLFLAATTAQAQRMVTYSSLTEGQTIDGFRTAAIYLNDADTPIGARFIHQKSGFTLDLLDIQSVPQAFVWVTTYPTSDMGEPHTQEHLLLGKGNMGRAVASHEPMSLAGSTAFTQQYRTCYSFYTSAGADVFYDEFDRRMDALLHPDYSDEEVHREVRNFGIAENPRDQSLSLEEKGTVYNEMVTSTDQPGRRVRSAAISMIYGANHPLQFNSGGSPEALRLIQPSDIRKFHAAHYFLANMGAVVSLPKEMTIDSVLQKLDATFNRIEPQHPNLPVMTEKDLPAPKPAAAGQIRFVEYPQRNDQQPGAVVLAWPADRNMDLTEQTMLELFLGAFAGDPTTNLYKRFIDSKTREINLGAQSTSASVQTDQGFPISVSFGDVPVGKMNDKDMADLRTRVIDEFSRVAGWKEGSPELQDFNNRVHSRTIQLRRDLAKFVNSPPGFGARNTGADWIVQLRDLEKGGGFRRSVTMKSTLDTVDRLLAGNSNVWAQYITKWKLTTDAPFVVAAMPSPELAARQQKEREDRVAAETARLRTIYNAASDQAALQRYRAEYDAATATIDTAALQVTPPKFVDKPPMTLDDQLDYKVLQLDGGIPLVASTFDSMTSATAGISLRLDGVPQDKLVFLSMFPQLLTGVGVIENGMPVAFQEMSERLRKEILGLNADFSTNPKTERVELTVRGSGNDPAESQRAIEWMKLVLFHPDWRPENLPRMRDLVDQVLNGLRRTPQAAEENWVNPVALVYWRQTNPLYMTTTSFMTQIHNVYRLRWMLKDAPPQQRAATAKALNDLSGLRGTRADLKARLAEIQSGPDKLFAEAAKDIDQTLPDIPESSLAIDWPRLCDEMARDLTFGPDQALAALNQIRQQILKTANARMFVISSATMQQTLAAPLASVAAALDKSPAAKAAYNNVRIIDSRLLERDPSATKPLFAGLLNPNSQGGVFMNSAPVTGYEDTDRDKILDYLSTNLYGGGGGHSIFMKTIGAGLAYSNGIGDSLALGRLRYYAERTPELPETMRFVIDQLKNAKPDPSLVEYAIAQAFAGTRSSNGYESRGEAMAQNLADGLTPAIVTQFHQQVLELRNAGDLAGELYRRKDVVSSKVLPGLGPKKSTVVDGVYFVIGPEKQFAAWEEYLKTVEGADTKVYRLYPRDFWM